MISFLRISLKLSKFLLDLLEYNASFIWNLVPFGSTMFALPEPSIKFDVPDIVLTLVFVVIKLKKYIFSRSIVCVVAQSVRHTSPSFILKFKNTYI